ncbi:MULTISPECIES: hypothetical protein [Sorangium]|uniref:hypothetical protein n=1 Tax=Sorangium TaxID=39643 RepID=UPI001F18C644|nr:MULTISPECIES: hypothetical protein [Sorangium]
MATSGCELITMPDRSLIGDGGSGEQGGAGGLGGAGGSGGNDGGGGGDGGSGGNDGGGGGDGGSGGNDGGGGGDGGSGGGDGGSGGGNGGSGGGNGGSGGGDGGSGGGNGGSGGGNGGSGGGDGGSGGGDGGAGNGNGGSGGVGGIGGDGGEGGVGGGAGGSGGSGGGDTCTVDADCAEPASECAIARCVDGGCVTEPVAAGTPAEKQMAGDCSERVCDDGGAVVEVDDDDDVPNDRSECTIDACRDGSPVHEPKAVGTACTLGDGGLCNAAGTCVECLVHTDCPSQVCLDYVCQTPTCEDGRLNGDEGGIDCGGSACPPCGPPAQVTSVDYPVIAVGGALVLTGTGFTGATEVTVSYATQPFRVDSDTRITIPALSGATPIGPGDIVVSRPGARRTSFRVTVLRLQINELDADTPDVDALEFVEISTGWRSTSLAGYTLVFFNGSADDASYRAIELNATTDRFGLLLVGNSGVMPAPALVFPNDTLQNGADAVALYQGLPADFPSGTPATSARLLDALVYDTNDADDEELLDALISSDPEAPERVQVNEGATAAPATQSIQRCADGARDGRRFVTAAPTPGRDNACP